MDADGLVSAAKTTLSWVSSLGLGGLIAWIIRDRLDERKAERDHDRQLRLRLHERRMQIAEGALTNLHVVVSALSGTFRAWRAELEGRYRHEMTASIFANAQNRLNQLAEDSHRAVLLLGLYFGEELTDELKQSDASGDRVTQLISEFMTMVDMAQSFAAHLEARLVAEPENEPEIRDHLVALRVAERDAQVLKLSEIIELVDHRQGTVTSIEKRLRSWVISRSDEAPH